MVRAPREVAPRIVAMALLLLLLLLQLQVHVVRSQVCDIGWVPYGGNCYYVGTANDNSALFSWYTARDWCMQRGADLATITSKQEADFIFAHLEGAFLSGLWIGLNKLQDQRNFQWADDSTDPFRYWSEGQPEGNPLGMCTYQMTRFPTNCFVRLAAHVSTILGLFSRPNDQEPGKKFYFGYLSLRSDEQGWEECELKCSAEPLCVTFTFISNQIPQNTTWMGECMGSNDERRIREPDPYSYSGLRIECSNIQLWFATNCGERRGFLCKKREGSGGSPNTIPPTPPMAGFCPSGYFESQGNKCFKIMEMAWDQGFTWLDAVALCRNGPGTAPDIASIQSIEENAAIAMHFPDYTRGMWIGMRMESAATGWTWVDNSPVSYTNWGQTSNLPNCAEIWTETGLYGTWRGIACNTKNGYVCQTYKDGTVVTPPTTPPGESCRAGYTPYGGACYRVDTTPRTWAAASAQCRSEGATLASIHGGQQNAALLLLAGGAAPFWIGYAKNVNDEWAWSDGWPTLYTNWALGDEPGSGGGCGLFKADSKWRDEDCSRTFASACRFSSASPPTTPTPVDGYCPKNWVARGDQCYFFSSASDGMKNWENALADCAYRATVFSTGTGSLVSIHNRLENDFVYNQLKALNRGEAWIGLHKESQTSPHQWTDGTPMDYERWAPGEPNDQEGSPPQLCNEMYVTYFPGFWNDHLCSQIKSFVCKAKMGVTPTTPYVPPGLTCPSGCLWRDRGEYCYYFALDQRIQFPLAQEECVRLAGRYARLPKVVDDDTNQFLIDTAKEVAPGSFNIPIWLGASRKTMDAPFRWMDGTTLTYSKWAPNEPNNQGNEHCVELWTSNEMWNDMNCITNPLFFVCQVRKQDLNLTVTTPIPVIEMKTEVYVLSHGEMAGVVMGTFVIVALISGITVLLVQLFPASAPAMFVSNMIPGGSSKYPPVRRRSQPPPSSHN